jgi:uncharacterized protein YgiM (DUF1202 family)
VTVTHRLYKKNDKYYPDLSYPEAYMKRNFLPLILIFMTAFVISCNKKEAAEPAEENTAVVISDEAINSAAMEYGHILLVNGAIYVIDEDTGEQTDKTRWAAAMSLGERVSAGEARKATFVSNQRETVYDYIKIRRDNGSEGYAYAPQIAVGGRLAVVTDDKGANLYRSPKAVDVSNLILSRKTVVVYYPETETDGYVQVRGYDPERRDYIRQDNNHIRFSTLSVRNYDIQASILLQTALSLPDNDANRVRRTALLEAALDQYPDSVFHAEIFQILHPEAAAALQAEVSSPSSKRVNDNNVNVREQPNTGGRVIGFLHSGDVVTIIETSAQTETINDQTSHWYKISSPLEGWVFGAFLQ